MTDTCKPYRVLFVCMGNICRSPAAEIIFRHRVGEAGLTDRIEIDSAGTIGYHAGNPPDPRMSETLSARGYEIAGSSRKIRARDLEDFDLILCADRDNLDDVRSLDPGGERHDRIHLITRYCIDREADHVPDPYYGGRRGFEEVADLVEDACDGLLAELTGTSGPVR
ncbi:phosphotyrosine protein phosphatase [Haloferula helveola]|uniref:Phosphotyrosine protein phosphatase n=1 Tax=Haloferula helveola TaxID=490095 RepID=A0ABM7RDL9_9BACT|nr:phosphotyrosine protein phosphatase [Haloferula helveola]